MFLFSFFLCPQGRRFIIYSTALIISVIFLSLTLAIGFLLPSNHHVLHCRCQTYYVGCLLIGDLLLAINQLGSLIPGKLCLAIGKDLNENKCSTKTMVLIFGFRYCGYQMKSLMFNVYLVKG